VLELIFLYYLCKNLGRNLRQKGRKPLLFQIMLVLMWFGGEVAGGIVAAVVYVLVQGQAPPEFSLPVYLGAIAGAACGAGFCFMIAWLVPPAYEEPSFADARDGAAARLIFPPVDPNNPYSSPQTWND
jgi:hypothetical protein